jgi:2-oxoglutarate ferredoxin oxidoreductase subunit alpha
MAEEVVLMKGNEAIAHAAIRIGVDGYFGYPITPQSEILETLAEEKPWETTGMVVLQAESEVAAINMVYGGAASGKMVMTSSSSPGVSLKQEGISYIAGAELPCLIVNVMRGGPGLGTIQPSQADYFQTVKGGGHGDYRLIALAPASVQEMIRILKTSRLLIILLHIFHGNYPRTNICVHCLLYKKGLLSSGLLYRYCGTSYHSP